MYDRRELGNYGLRIAIPNSKAKSCKFISLHIL